MTAHRDPRASRLKLADRRHEDPDPALIGAGTGLETCDVEVAADEDRTAVQILQFCKGGYTEDVWRSGITFVHTHS
jgi:hypothetical protein